MFKYLKRENVGAGCTEENWPTVLKPNEGTLLSNVLPNSGWR